MNRTRIIETNEGIQAEAIVADFNLMQRGFRDRGILATGAIIKSGINAGHTVELGLGPGYLGLEWLKSTTGSNLTGIEISPAMIKTAETNRAEYGMKDRATYIEGSVLAIPLNECSADNVFSNGSLHEWEDPYRVISEAHRILKPGGRLFISDLKRNLNTLVTASMRFSTKGKVMKAGLMSSIRASYTAEEMRRLLEWSAFDTFSVRESPFGLELIAKKE